MDATLLTILALLVFATVLALIRARRRDRCLRSLDGFYVTLAEKGGDMVWGRAHVYATGLEIEYPKAVTAREGHLERSFIFYKDQYGTMESLYRCPEGLSDEAQRRRAKMIDRTAHPGIFRRFLRWIRNWMGMVRDALVKSVGMIVGLAKTRVPGSAVFSSQEKNMQALSDEIIGHTGNAFDPLLECHLFTQVVVEVTSEGTKRSYCGWLKDYTSEFIEVLDAFANTPDTRSRPVQGYAPGDDRLPHIDTRIDGGRIHVTNTSERMLYFQHVEAEDWSHPVDAVLPPGFTANVTLPPAIDYGTIQVWVGTAERVDMIVPRQHALVRHAAGGSEESFREHRQNLQQTQTQPERLSQPSAVSEEAHADTPQNAPS